MAPTRVLCLVDSLKLNAAREGPPRRPPQIGLATCAATQKPARIY